MVDLISVASHRNPRSAAPGAARPNPSGPRIITLTHPSRPPVPKAISMHLSTLLTLLATLGTSIVLASEWPIPIPQSLLPENKDQRAYSLNPPRPDNVRLIQTVEGKYQWTGDIEALLREGVRLMDVLPHAAQVVLTLLGDGSLASC